MTSDLSCCSHSTVIHCLVKYAPTIGISIPCPQINAMGSAVPCVLPVHRWKTSAAWRWTGRPVWRNRALPARWTMLLRGANPQQATPLSSHSRSADSTIHPCQLKHPSSCLDCSKTHLGGANSRCTFSGAMIKIRDAGAFRSWHICTGV